MPGTIGVRTMQHPMNCTIFSVSDVEMTSDRAPDTSLPAFGSTVNSRITALSSQQILQLGDQWIELHKAWGEPPPDHPLGFFTGGGVPEDTLNNISDQSSGRYFDADAVGRIVAALDEASSAVTPGLARRMFTGARPANASVQETFHRLAAFLRETRAAGRGMIVHQFR